MSSGTKESTKFQAPSSKEHPGIKHQTSVGDLGLGNRDLKIGSTKKALAESPPLVYLSGGQFPINTNVMKRLTILLTGLLGFTLNAAHAGETPRGTLMELHSCELFAGGCTVSAEAPQWGRYMLRVWNFSGGTFNGTELKGLQIAALQTSPDNLATTDSKAGDAVVYLPQSATPSERDALLAWLNSSQKDFRPAKIQTRVAPLQFTKSGDNYVFSAGDSISVKSEATSCDTTACGEALWYQPRAMTSYFTVVENSASKVNEPLLQLTWTDAGKRSVFLARFGETEAAKNVYVTMGELCGVGNSLF